MERFSTEGYAVTATSRRPDAQKRGLISLDLEDPSAAVLPSCDVAIICAAMARFADCRSFPIRARRVNVTTPLALAARLAKQGSSVIMLSTSAVFDGTKPRSMAETPVSPKSDYGRLKAEVEAGILALGSSGSVLRLTKVIHPGMPLFEGWIDDLKAGRTVQAYSDLTICPITINDVTTALFAVAADGAGGVYQVSGTSDISYLQVGHHIANALGANRTLVQATSAVASGVSSDEVLRFTSLDTSRLNRLVGFVPPEPERVLDHLLRHREES
jgi:dTDP-4-dehydrorhamnose reductase